MATFEQQSPNFFIHTKPQHCRHARSVS